MIYLDRPQPLRTWELFYSQLLVLNSQLRTTQKRLVLDSSTRSERTPYDDHRHYQHAPRTLQHTGHTLQVSEAAGPQAGALRPGARLRRARLCRLRRPACRCADARALWRPHWPPQRAAWPLQPRPSLGPADRARRQVSTRLGRVRWVDGWVDGWMDGAVDGCVDGDTAGAVGSPGELARSSQRRSIAVLVEGELGAGCCGSTAAWCAAAEHACDRAHTL